MVALVLIVLGIVGGFALAMRRAALWQWALGLLVLGLLTRIGPSGIASDAVGWIFALLPALVVGLLAITPVRRPLIIAPAYRLVKSILPRVSRTEQEALDAGTVGWDAELFSGRPDWSKLLGVRKGTLSAEEQAFIDGPCNTVCAMIDDWDIRHNRADLPPEVWAYLKEQGFLGMLIGKEWGGLGFSAQAQSQVVSKVASRSVAAGITVMVPNSLGPGELLEKYGTSAQKEMYLRRLARGQEVPCFALTGPYAGSDAASMRDVGIVCYEMYQGKKTLGVRLSWDKRYITLAPVATLVGLAFHLHDPEHLIGETEKVGITLALIPARLPRRRDRPAALSGARGLHERPDQGTERLRADGLPHRRRRLCRAGLADADGVPVDWPCHLAAGDRHGVDQARAAGDIGLCTDPSAIRHRGGNHGGRRGAAQPAGALGLYVRGGAESHCGDGR